MHRAGFGFGYYFVNIFENVVLLSVIIVQFVVVPGNGYMVNNNPYHRRENLDPDGKYNLEWVTDWNKKTVTFKVTVETNGYVGFGLASIGKMQGADIVIGGVRRNGEVYFSDRHAVGNQLPEVDASQDWMLRGAWENGTHTFLSFSRPFDTCDPQDYPITENKISLIWAYGERDDVFEYHHQNKGKYDVYLIEPYYAPPVARDRNGRIRKVSGIPELEDLKVWGISTKLKIPSQDTTYWCTVHTPPKLARKHHIVGFETRFPSEQSRRHVHHISLYKCHVPPELNGRSLYEPLLNYGGDECFMMASPLGPIQTQYCTEFTWAWAQGGRVFVMPPHVGIPIGESPNEFYVVQVHYDNPNRLSNVTVEVELDSLYTSNVRPNDAGMLLVRSVAPGLTPTILIPPSTTDHKAYAHCGPECTREMFPSSGISIAGVFLHAHNSGVGIRYQHFRNGRELPWILADDNYNNRYQDIRSLRKDVRVLPGDQLTLQCTYDNTWTNTSIVGGFSTRQEMCNAFTLYYTKLENHAQCFSQMESEEYREYFLGVKNITWSLPNLQYVVDRPHPLAGLTMTEVSDNHVSWTLAKRAELKRFHLIHHQINRCPTLLPTAIIDRSGSGNSNLSRDVIMSSVGYPLNARPYIPEETCSFKNARNNQHVY